VVGTNIKSGFVLGHLMMTNWQTTEIREGVAALRKAAMHRSGEDYVAISVVFGDTAANWSGCGGRGEEAAMKDIDPLFLMNNKRSVNGDKAGK
jgi:hypothetical protein